MTGRIMERPGDRPSGSAPGLRSGTAGGAEGVTGVTDSSETDSPKTKHQTNKIDK